MMFSRDLIWITTTAAGGKTTARLAVKNVLEKNGVHCGLLNDGIFLVQIVNEDDLKGEKWHFHPHEGNPAFCITAQYPLDETVRRLVAEIPGRQEGRVTLIELARGVGDGSLPGCDISYSRLLEAGLIPQEILGRSIFVYIDTPWELRLRWNKDRKDNPRGELDGMSFYCPTAAMEKHFGGSDFETGMFPQLKRLGVPVLIIRNDKDGHKEFKEKVEEVALLIYWTHFSKEGQVWRSKEREFS